MRPLRACALALVLAAACGSNQAADDTGPGPGPDAAPIEPAFMVHLVPAAGASGAQVVSFAIPLAPGYLHDATAIRVAHGGADLAAARVPLATHPDGSLASVLVQVEVTLTGEAELAIEVGGRGGGDRAAVPVADTLAGDGTPRVWALLPATWLAASGAFGASVPQRA